ncbi:hypothetical protein HDV05_006279 [Chytridiales sp. JEL 0842]|nr:hypothetical protein HDV05_006279 [Chytridiales sp. JEL 0842]
MVLFAHACIPVLGTTTILPRNAVTFPITVCLLLERNVDHKDVEAELWTNFGCQDASEWQAIPLERSNLNGRGGDSADLVVGDLSSHNAALVFKCSLDLHQHDAKDFEFTARAKVKGVPNRYFWLGDDGGPANVRVLFSKVSPTTEQLTIQHIFDLSQEPTQNWSFTSSKTQTSFANSANAASHPPLIGRFSTCQNTFKLVPRNHLGSTLLLHKQSRSWIQPAFGDNSFPKASFGKDVYYILWQLETDGDFVVLMASRTAVMQTTERGEIWIRKAGAMKSNDFGGEDAWIHVGVGSDPTKVAEACFRMAYGKALIDESLETIESAKERHGRGDTTLIDYLGWCTWNSFYEKVSEEKVKQQLKVLQDSGIRVGYVLIDDGWQDVDDQSRLSSIAPNEKFNKSFDFVKELKTLFGINYVGVWHSILGYWAGISPAGNLATNYATSQIRRKTDRTKIACIDSKSVLQFYKTFHASLYASGIDFIKVDDQSVFEDYEDGESLAVAYQDALAAAVTERGGPVIYYIPASHPWHIIANALNTLLLGPLATFSTTSKKDSNIVLDYDMFQTTHAFSKYHAILRAISGGPIYISDPIHHHNIKTLEPLLYPSTTTTPTQQQPPPHSRILRFPHPPIVHSTSLLQNIQHPRSLVILENGASWGCRVLALFNATQKTSHPNGVFQLLNVQSTLHRLFSSSQCSKALVVVASNEGKKKKKVVSLETRWVGVYIPHHWAEVVALTPVWELLDAWISTTGFEGKYGGCVGVEGVEAFQQARMMMMEGGGGRVRGGGLRVKMGAGGKVRFYVGVGVGEGGEGVLEVRCRFEASRRRVVVGVDDDDAEVEYVWEEDAGGGGSRQWKVYRLDVELEVGWNTLDVTRQIPS